MKLWIIILCLSSNIVLAKDFKLARGQAEYTVSHLVKTVKGTSKELKGKMVCNDGSCEFLVAIAVKSFISSDSNRDSNMQTILEIIKYPLITVQGQLTESDLAKDHFALLAKEKLHGVEKDYTLKLVKKEQFSGSLTLSLKDHNVERPSLLTVAIENEVPVHFSLLWSEDQAR